MRLIDHKRQNGCWVIFTDEGDRQQSLKWRGIEELEAKCERLKDKLIKTSTWKPEENSPDVWFSDIWEVDEQGNRVLDRNEQWSSTRHPAFASLNDSGSESRDDSSKTDIGSIERTSLRIYGPPGTGKTTTLINEEVGMALDNGVRPDKIAFLTFTNVAADAAASKLRDEVGLTGVDFPYFCTLHKLATRLGGTLKRSLMTDEHRRKFDPNFFGFRTEWLKEGDLTSIVDRPSHPILDSWSLYLAKGIEFPFDELGAGGDLEVCLKKFFDKEKIEPNEIGFYTKRFIRAYLDFKDSYGLVDYDDVLLNASDKEKVSDDALPNLELLVVDEAQDLSGLQWRFVERLAEKAKRLVIAGDDDQAILSSFGSMPERFVNYPTTEKDRVLNVSHRVPLNIKERVDRGVLEQVKNVFKDRVEKIWTSRADLENGKVVDSVNYLATVIDEIEPRQNENWLVLAPTNKSVDDISRGLEEMKIPHFRKNKPVPTNIGNEVSIRVKTIHTAKGEEADNVLVCSLSKGDEKMFNEDPRLAYVAETRAKKELHMLESPKPITPIGKAILDDNSKG